MRISTVTSALSILALLGGCSVGGQSSICAEAAAHLADCEGGEPVEIHSCDSASAQAAESAVGASCSELAGGGGNSDIIDSICIAIGVATLGTALPRHIAPGGLCCLGVQCDGSANTCISHRCGPRLPVNSKCNANNDCQSGLTCLPSGKCGAPLPAGASCEEKEDCVQPLTCGVDHLCDEAAVDGTSCVSENQCQHLCIQGICATASTAGGPCDGAPDCDGFLACVNHTCTAMALGSVCANDQDCFALSLTCQFGNCAARVKTGELCDSAAQYGCESFDDSCYMNACRPKAGLGGACAVIFDCKHALCIDGTCQ